MKRSIFSFNKLSVKRAKTYAAVIFMITLTIQAVATGTEANYDENIEMNVQMETRLDAEMPVEKWMTKPFFFNSDEVLAIENGNVFPEYELMEEDMALKEWMTSPFETDYTPEACDDPMLLCSCE